MIVLEVSKKSRGVQQQEETLELAKDRGLAERLALSIEGVARGDIFSVSFGLNSL